MFDAETTKLIQQTAPLEGLDLEQLPQFLTEAYAQVIAARLGVARIAGEQKDGEWTRTILKLRGLAETYEGLTIFLSRDSQYRSSCAFVSGSAHFTLSQARRLQARADGVADLRPSLSVHSVGPEVAACLLFLIAGQQADAAETAKAFQAETGNAVMAQLLERIAAMASGDGERLRSIASRSLTQPSVDADMDYLDRAANRLWRRLERAVQLIARKSLGMNVTTEPQAVISEVLELLNRAQAEISVGNTATRVRLPLEGPYHLARLLEAVSDVLLRSAVIGIPPPIFDDGAWTSFLRYFAGRKPFLWRNHLSAIEKGFLEEGTSFVLTFPTGAGKTTITELRIAAELMRGRKVVYLAPTRALVEQVAAEVSNTLRPIAPDVVRGRFLEDFGERAGARVYVQTPEQCLAYLSFEPEAHNDIGLIVVDECHQLSGEHPDDDGRPRLPGRRSVDAMWTLLSLLHRSPTADVVLISAMVRNGEELVRWLATTTGRPASLLDLAWKPTRQVRGFVAYNSSEVRALQDTLRARRSVRGWGNKPNAADGRDLNATPIGLFCHTQVWNTASTFANFPLLSASVPLGVSGNWGLIPNRNAVGARLLAAMAQAKMRPIVFSQQIGWTVRVADLGASELEAAGVPEVVPTAEEEAWFAAAAAELGAPDCVERPLRNRVGVHHGILLLSERIAMESAFRRENGLLALVATPTVAQGINLPAEAVIIAGDDRWNDEGGEAGPETLAVHELLNAAGRAGRAGHYAHGIVIDLPGKVFHLEEDEDRIEFNGLEHAMGLFGSSDQCLDIVDPVTQVIDRIQQAGTETDIGNYLVRRAAGLDETTLVGILGSTFGNAFRDQREQVASTQAALLKNAAARLEQMDKSAEAETDTWREFASQVGTSPLVIAAVAALIPSTEIVAGWTFENFIDFALTILVQENGMLFGLVNPSSADLARIMPQLSEKTKSGATVYLETLEAWEGRWQTVLREVLPQWLNGVPLKPIGDDLHRHRGAKGHVKAIHLGRRFALQAASGIAYGIALISRIFEQTREDATSSLLSDQLPLAAGCVREGFDVPDKLLLFWHLRRKPGLYPRVRVHQFYSSIKGKLPPWDSGVDVEERRSLIRALVGDDAL